VFAYVKKHIRWLFCHPAACWRVSEEKEVDARMSARLVELLISLRAFFHFWAAARPVEAKNEPTRKICSAWSAWPSAHPDDAPPPPAWRLRRPGIPGGALGSPRRRRGRRRGIGAASGPDERRMPEIWRAVPFGSSACARCWSRRAFYAPRRLRIGTPGAIHFRRASSEQLSLGAAIGAVTFTGSVIAFLKCPVRPEAGAPEHAATGQSLRQHSTGAGR